MGKLKKHRVLVREVHVRTVEILAEDQEDAINLVAHGEGDSVAFEYGHTLERGTWTIEIPEAIKEPLDPGN